MSVQSFIRGHLSILAVLAAVLVFAIIPVALWLLGYSLSQLGIRETWPKLIVAGVALGAVMTVFLLVLDRVSPKLARSPYVKTIVQIIALAVALNVAVMIK